MRSRKTIVPGLAVPLVLLLAAGAAAQTFTGSVAGVVRDEQGGVLPGASVNLTGKMGTRTATSEADGSYRFNGVDPGNYELVVQLSGFAPLKRENLAVSIGKTTNADFALKVGGLSDTVNVIGEVANVDVTSSSTDNNLSQDLLFNVPIRQGSNAGLNLLNFLPGINNSSAYGGDATSGNGLLIDGVDTRDPSGGTAWTFYDYNLVEEVQAVGLGAPAEFGAFTGAIINTLTKSGGNRFSGLFNVIYTKASLAGENIGSEVKDANPSLGDPAKTRELTDFTTQLGGPIIKDKLFFFASAERFHQDLDPTGPITIRDEVSPRFDFKLTYQPSPNDTLKALVQYDSYNIIGRAGVSAAVATDDLTNREDAPEWVWLTQWSHVFGSNTMSEVKYTGWWGFFDLNPEVKAPSHFDGEVSLYSVSQGWFYYADRGRHQVNASISTHAEGWGKHDFKFGVEIERSRTRDRYGYTNSTYYYDYGGAPYLAYSYGYDVSGRNHRESVFVQDSWKVSDRLTLNPGVRMDHVSGNHPDRGKIYGNTMFAPRLGFAFDLTGDHRTVLKGNYSQYYEGIFNDLYKLATPGYQDRIAWDMTNCPGYGAGPTASYNCPMASRIETDRTPQPNATVDPDLKHPRVDEFSFGVERAIGRNIRVGATGVFRNNQNFVGSVFPLARWTRTSVTSTATPALPATTIPAYNWANRAASIGTLLITNPDGFQYRDPSGNVLGTLDAERKYKALMLVFNKGYSDRWRANVSYVLSKAEGTIDNTSEALFGPSRFFETPTLALVNSSGTLTNSRTHELKAMVGYQVPRIEVAVNANWRTLSGRNYTPFQRFASSAINFSTTYFSAAAGRQPLLEPRGTRRLPTENYLDLRVEKVFRVGSRQDRIAVYADITNVFNEGTITQVLTRVPSTTLFLPPPAAPGTTEAVNFEAPSQIIAPRQIILGARWSF